MSFQGTLSSTARSTGPRAKPQLAADLEAFMTKELLHLSKDADHCNPLERIPIVSETFGAFISRCTEYHDFLSMIKKEYDVAWAEGIRAQRSNHQLELINENSMEYLSHIVGAEKISSEAMMQEKDRKVKEMRQAMNQQTEQFSSVVEEHHDLKNRVAHLSKIVDDLTLTNKILSDGLKQETLHRSLMVQQGKKLRSDNDKLAKKVQMLEYKMRQDQILQSTEDPEATSPRSGAGASIVHNSSSAASLSPHGSDRAMMVPGSKTNSAASLHREASVVGDVIGHSSSQLGPLGSYDQYVELEEKLRRALHLLRKERTERESLEDQLKESGTTRIDRPLTPRPSWISVKAILPKWSLPQQSSDEILNDIVTQVKASQRDDKRADEVASMSKAVREWFGENNLCEGDLSRGQVKTFIGRGNGPHVPVFLRFQGHLRNRRLNKGDVENMLKHFWTDRKRSTDDSAANGGVLAGGGATATSGSGDASPILSSGPLSIQDYFLEWLIKCTGSHQGAIELAYNIMDVCSRFTRDPDCGMFLAILNNDVNEAAYFDQLSVVEQLQMVLRHHDKNDIGILKRSRVHHILLKLFPAKSLDAMLRLRFALLSHLDIHTDCIRYAEVFEEDHDGNQTRFVELVREQHLEEMMEYIVDVEEAIREAPNAEGVLTASMVRNALHFLDPKIPSAKMDSLLACGLKIHAMSSEFDEMHVSPEDFILRLRKGILLTPYSRREGGDTGGLGEIADVTEDPVQMLLDERELDEMDEKDVDPAALAALQAMDKQLMDQYGGSLQLPRRAGKAAPVPEVVEETMKLLRQTTVATIKATGSVSNKRGVVVTLPS
ncbi:Hypothetical protein, putative [Bodo saltans]|uniref:Translin-associated factor X-interacting protein 1 N-terminal domain-containing protein n=1 Tax=Bodo saltans TaxID=75058 RepID=A0A0S4J4R0_BODSA|nr:Hypothetical protein, putative [Bodo saltans]|eukprot:CUG83694.1 Hypothetical protein, putative [Bodo saltans]